MITDAQIRDMASETKIIVNQSAVEIAKRNVLNINEGEFFLCESVGEFVGADGIRYVVETTIRAKEHDE